MTGSDEPSWRGQLGDLEIVEPLGAGETGEVYRAKDTRLERGAAIKMLPEHLTSDTKALKRLDPGFPS